LAEPDTKNALNSASGARQVRFNGGWYDTANFDRASLGRGAELAGPAMKAISSSSSGSQDRPRSRSADNHRCARLSTISVFPAAVDRTNALPCQSARFIR
jgi:hypothetical protein